MVMATTMAPAVALRARIDDPVFIPSPPVLLYCKSK
jgi:hypothetical protein